MAQVEGVIGASKTKNAEYGDYGIMVGDKRWFNTSDEALWRLARDNWKATGKAEVDGRKILSLEITQPAKKGGRWGPKEHSPTEAMHMFVRGCVPAAIQAGLIKDPLEIPKWVLGCRAAWVELAKAKGQIRERAPEPPPYEPPPPDAPPHPAEAVGGNPGDDIPFSRRED